MKRWERYSRGVERHRIGILIAAALLTAFGVWLASRLDLKTDFSELLPRNSPAVKELSRIQSRIGGLSTLVVAIEGGDWKAREGFAEQVVTALKTKLPKDDVHFIDYKVGEARAFLEKNRFLYVDVADLREILSRIHKKIEDTESRKLVVALDDDDKPYQFTLDDIRKKYETQVKDYDHFPDGYFITPDKSLQALLLRIPASDFGGSSTDKLVGRARAIIDELNPKEHGYNILIGGDPVTAQEERSGIVADILVVSISSIVLVVLAMSLYFRLVRSVLLIASPVAVGATLAFGIAELTIGNLNSNTAFLGSIIVVGNGINFGIILLARYLEERRGGHAVPEALETAIGTTWASTATAALAASLAYGSLMVTDFRGFSQFGFIGGIGMVLCWIATYTVLPAIISLVDSRWPFKVSRFAKLRDPSPAIGRFFSRDRRIITYAGILLSLAGIVAAVIFYRDPFEYNFRKLRSRKAENTGGAVFGRRVDKIFEGTQMMAGSPSLILIDRIEQLDPLLAALEAKKAAGEYIGRTESIHRVLPSGQVEKLVVIDEIRKLIDKKILAWASPEEKKQIDEYRPPDALKQISFEDLPELLARPFTEASGKRGLIVYVYPPPGNDFLNGRMLLKFAHAIEEVPLPAAESVRTSGHEVIMADILANILKDGPITTAASFTGVLILVSLAFRRMRERMLVIVTLLCGITWMCGLAAILQIKVNMLNFVALPITFGIGVEYPTNLYRRYIADGRKDLGNAIWFTGTAVALCSLTTIIGYGSLLLADTRALNSFGLLAVIGEITTLLAALLWMPALLARKDKD